MPCSLMMIHILFFDEGQIFYKVIFFADEIGILGVNVEKISLADVNDFYEDDPEIIIHVKYLD